MDFFKSVFSDDLDQTNPKSNIESPTKPPLKGEDEEDPEPNSSSDQPHLSSNPNSSGACGGEGSDRGGGSGWSFGGLLKTLSTKSESVIETYRRDLKEFGSGLKKETETFREAASRAVKDLPVSIEVAQGSLETVGHAIDELGTSVWKSTADIISHGNETLLAADVESDSSENNNPTYSNLSVNSKQYSRLDVRVRAIQSDLSTYCEEPEDLNDYNKWKLGFVLEGKAEEVEKLIEENVAIEGLYRRVVPNEVDHETFWCRYFYKVHKLKQAEDVRANLVKRAISKEDEEDLTWDVDDDDKEEQTNALSKGDSLENIVSGNKGSKQNVGEKEESLEKGALANKDASPVVEEEKEDSLENRELGNRNSSSIAKESSGEELRGGSTGLSDEEGKNESSEGNGGAGIVMEAMSDDLSSDNVCKEKIQSEGIPGMNSDGSVLKSNEKRDLEGRTDSGESSKDSDFSVVSTQPSLPEEEDLEWDEIEDLGSNDEKKVTHGGSPNRTDLRKRLSVAEEEEDLSWDIEDEDEPAKA